MNELEPIRLVVLSPEKQILDTECSRVTLPGSKGSFSVLKNHRALLSSLDAGSISYRAGEQEKEIVIRSGFVEVKDNRVTVCVEL